MNTEKSKPVIHNPMSEFNSKMESDRQARQEQNSKTSVDAILKMQARLTAAEGKNVALEARIANLEQGFSALVTAKKASSANAPTARS